VLIACLATTAGTGVPLLRCTYEFDRRRNEANVRGVMQWALLGVQYAIRVCLTRLRCQIRVEQIPPQAAFYGKLEFNICEVRGGRSSVGCERARWAPVCREGAFRITMAWSLLSESTFGRTSVTFAPLTSCSSFLPVGPG